MNSAQKARDFLEKFKEELEEIQMKVSEDATQKLQSNDDTEQDSTVQISIFLHFGLDYELQILNVEYK